MSSPAPRFDIYRQVHKALRILFARTHAYVGRMDCHDTEDLHAALQAVEALLATCRSHLQHENEFVHAALEARAAQASQHTANDHRHHDEAILQLSQRCVEVARAEPAHRQAIADRLYDELGEFITENLVHMRHEETINNAALWAHYTDAELFALEQALIASMPPDEVLRTLPAIVAAVPPSERLAMLDGIRHSAPPPVFDAMLDASLHRLDARDGDKLLRGLGVARPQVAPLAA